jgi:hypothetical protein
LSNIANIFVFMILYDFCLLPLFNRSRCSHLRPLDPSGSLVMCQLVQYTILLLPLLLPLLLLFCGAKSSEFCRCPTIPAHAVGSSFFLLGGGRTLDSVQSLTSRSLMKTWVFVSSSICMGFLKFLSDVPIHRGSFFFKSRSFMPFLHVSPFHCLLTSVRPFVVPVTKLPLPGPIRIRPFRSAGTACCIILTWAAS